MRQVAPSFLPVTSYQKGPIFGVLKFHLGRVFNDLRLVIPFLSSILKYKEGLHFYSFLMTERVMIP